MDIIGRTGRSIATMAATVFVAVAPSVAFSADQGGRASSTCQDGELSRAQQIVVANENEKARLGAQGFSPLRHFPVPEVQWRCWR